MADISDIIRGLNDTKDRLTDIRAESDRVYDESSAAYKEFSMATSTIIDDGNVFRDTVFTRVKQGMYLTGFDWLAEPPPDGSHALILLNELFNAYDILERDGERVTSLHLSLRDSGSDKRTMVSTRSDLTTLSILRDVGDGEITGIRLSLGFFYGDNVYFKKVLLLKGYCERYGFRIDPQALLIPYAEARRYYKRFCFGGDGKDDADCRMNNYIIDRYPVMLGFLAMIDVLTEIPGDIIERCNALAGKPYGKKEDDDSDNDTVS